MTDESLQPVLSHYALASPLVRVEPLANAGGWSGSLLWRLTYAANQPYCLRRWPVEHPTQERLQFIHNVLLHVARELTIIPSPIPANSGSTFINHAGHFWELSNWLPGAADFDSNPSPARLRAAMQALASFHLCTAQFQARLGPAPAIDDRLQQIQTLDRGELVHIEQALATSLSPEIDARAGRMLRALKQRLQRSLLPCPIPAATPLSLQPAIRDIHHDHVLFTGDSVTGLIDFGAMRVDTPLTDIARLLGSLVADDPSARTIALNAYAELRPLTNADRQLIDWLDQANVVCGALNWLRWLYIERRDMGPLAPIAERLEQITRRLAIE